MKLKTSFFNGRVLRKNISRFAPLWILYAVGEVLGLMTLNQSGTDSTARELIGLFGPVAGFHLCYAFLAAACLFGDLFDSRMCNGLHAMPMRREGWLITNLISGLVFALIPAAVGGIVAAVMLGKYSWVALAWQGVSLLQFVLFFGIAVFSAICAGKRLGMAAIYALINFLPLLVYWIVNQFYIPLLRGVVLPEDPFLRACPIATIFRSDYVDYEMVGAAGNRTMVIRGFVASDWRYLGICAGAGVGFLVLAWLLYRKRHLETAGDFISFQPLRYVFLAAYTITAGVLLDSVFRLFIGRDDTYVFLAVGVIIGYFTGWMLLERTVKVITGKVLIGFGIFAALIAGSIGLTAMDPLGIASYVPKAEEVKSVCLYPSMDNYTYASGNGWHITDPAEIAQVQALHRQLIDTPPQDNGYILIAELSYELENGKCVRRSYKVPAESAIAGELRGFFNDVRSVFATDNWEHLKATIDSVEFWLDGKEYYNGITDPQQIQALLAAVEADSREGNLLQNYYTFDWHYLGNIEFYSKAEPGEIVFQSGLEITDQCVHILDFLKTIPKTE